MDSLWFSMGIYEWVASPLQFRDPLPFSVGEKKLGRVACPDPWKSGARNTVCTYVCEAQASFKLVISMQTLSYTVNVKVVYCHVSNAARV